MSGGRQLCKGGAADNGAGGLGLAKTGVLEEERGGRRGPRAGSGWEVGAEARRQILTVWARSIGAEAVLVNLKGSHTWEPPF